MSGKGALKQVVSGWGIEIDDFDRRFLVGIGYSPWLLSAAADWSKPLTTLTFKTRAEARSVLARYRTKNAWCFTGKPISAGGNRIYRSARVVPLKITVEIA